MSEAGDDGTHPDCRRNRPFSGVYKRRRGSRRNGFLVGSPVFGKKRTDVGPGEEEGEIPPSTLCSEGSRGTGKRVNYQALMLQSGKGQRITVAPLRAHRAQRAAPPGLRRTASCFPRFRLRPLWRSFPSSSLLSSRYHTRLEFRKHGPLYRNILTVKLNIAVPDWL